MKHIMEQMNCNSLHSNLRLIPPLSDDFVVYGGVDTIRRARAWALRHHYLLVEGVSRCAHGLYTLASCPGRCLGLVPDLDHVNMWVPDSPASVGRPFLLSHPYSDKIADVTHIYARSHGLNLDSYKDDGWYGHDTIPIRFDVPASWPVWPIEAESIVMLYAQPVKWPEEVVEYFDEDFSSKAVGV